MIWSMKIDTAPKFEKRKEGHTYIKLRIKFQIIHNLDLKEKENVYEKLFLGQKTCKNLYIADYFNNEISILYM